MTRPDFAELLTRYDYLWVLMLGLQSSGGGGTEVAVLDALADLVRRDGDLTVWRRRTAPP